MTPDGVTQHCELVAFIQDNDTKEILQGSMIELNNLQPMQATAGFSASNTTTCEGGSVNFIDGSLGIITSYEWHFEGGTPATSTDANPTVTYNTNGVYDVTQIVSDGTTSDTLEMEDYITAMSVPAQAGTPSGSADPCQNSSPQYSTDPVTYASSYTWTVEPANAGSFSGNGATTTLNLSQTYTGTINIKVRAENECGDGAWSNALTSTVRATPTIYNITAQGTGAYCEGTSGTELLLDGSETGVDYELFLDDVSTGIFVSGTGDTISFGVQSEEGIYTAMGATDYCSQDMSGQHLGTYDQCSRNPWNSSWKYRCLR
ncbi:MAG: PKD domain-containing protein [Bacteroidota bacterium]|nr:PKD domain-containing protein [Bacteroidota bacterium]